MTCIFCFIINHYTTTAASWLWSPWQPQRYQLNVWFNTVDKSIAVQQTQLIFSVLIFLSCMNVICFIKVDKWKYRILLRVFFICSRRINFKQKTGWKYGEMGRENGKESCQNV